MILRFFRFQCFVSVANRSINSVFSLLARGEFLLESGATDRERRRARRKLKVSRTTFEVDGTIVFPDQDYGF